jgi:hypothetical protein
MALGRKKLEPEPEPEPTDTFKHKLMFCLRILSALCGAAISAIGLFVSIAAGPKHSHWTWEMYMGALFVGGFQVLFGLLILAAEWRMVCVARLFGFMALRIGKASILIFSGALMCSLSKAWADNNAAPLVVGITCLSVGVVQFFCALPCGPCTLPSDPLRAKLGTGKAPAKEKGRGRKGAQDNNDEAAPTGGMRGKLFRGASSNDVEVSATLTRLSSSVVLTLFVFVGLFCPPGRWQIWNRASALGQTRKWGERAALATPAPLRTAAAGATRIHLLALPRALNPACRRSHQHHQAR